MFENLTYFFRMQKSIAGTIRSQNAQNNTKTRQQRTATTNRTGGNLSSGHTSSAHKIIERQKPKVFDEANIDVTPKPMMEVEIVQKTRHGSALFHSMEGTSTVNFSFRLIFAIHK